MFLQSANMTKLVSEAWRNLPEDKKKKYQEMSVMDKRRYDEETVSYKGRCGTTRPKKKPKDPEAPKRPMSAFIAFANSRRAEVKADNPECSNGDISRLLSAMWKDTPDIIRQKYRDAELASWTSYKEQMMDLRKKNDGRKKSNKVLGATLQPKSNKKQNTRHFDEDSLAGNSFDDPSFTGLASLEHPITTSHDGKPFHFRLRLVHADSSGTPFPSSSPPLQTLWWLLLHCEE